MPLLRRDALLATSLSLPEARARLVEAVRAPGERGEAPAALLLGWIEGWDFEVSPGPEGLPSRWVAARGRLLEEAGETRVALLLRPGRVALVVLVLGLLALSVAAALAAVMAIVASTRRGAPHWVGALGIVLPGLSGVGWLSLWDSGFQRGAAQNVALLAALLEARELPAGAGA
jgi:hypothetical protein